METAINDGTPQSAVGTTVMLLVVFLPPTRRNTALQRVRPTVQLVKRSVTPRQSRARRSVQQKKRGVQHFVAFLRASSSRPFYCKQLPLVLCLTNPHPSKVFFKKLRRSSTPCTTPWGAQVHIFLEASLINFQILFFIQLLAHSLVRRSDFYPI